MKTCCFYQEQIPACVLENVNPVVVSCRSAANAGSMAERFSIQRVPLSAKDLEKAKNELRETPEVVKEALEKLRKLIQEENGLTWGDSDEFLTAFLRPSHWYAESALELIKRIADFRVKNWALIGDLEPKTEQQRMMSNVVNVIPERDQEGRRMLIVNCGAMWDPSEVNTDYLFRLLYLVHLAALNEPATQVNGVVVIMDFKGMGMKQVKAFTPAFSMRLLTFIQHAMPMRLKAVHIVKEPFVFNMVFQLFKPFIQEKLKSRMYFHGDKMKKLHEHVSPAHLPEDYGGTLPKINYGGKEWYEPLMSAEDTIKFWQTIGMKNAA